MSLIDQLPHRAAIRRTDYQQDEVGGTRRTSTVITTGVECWVQNAGMREVEQYAKMDTAITHKVFFATEVDLRPGDDLVVTGGPSFLGVVLDLRAGPTERSAGLGRLWAAMFEQENNLQRARSPRG